MKCLKYELYERGWLKNWHAIDKCIEGYVWNQVRGYVWDMIDIHVRQIGFQITTPIRGRLH